MMDYFTTILEHARTIRPELAIGLLLCIIIHKIWSSKNSRPKIPGPYPWPILGNVISLGKQPQISMQNMAKKYGSVFLMKLGSEDVLVLNDYQSIKEALGRQKLVFEGRPLFNSFAKISQGKGIVFNSPLTMGKNWQRLKAIVLRQLHRYITMRDTLRQLGDHVRKESVEMVNKIQLQCQQSPNGFVHPESLINVSVANMICALTFGHRYDYNNKEFQDLVSLNREFGDVVGAGSQVDVMPWIRIFPSLRKALKTFDFLTNRFNNWMKNRTTEHRNTYHHGVTRDLLDTMISESVENPNGLLKNDVVMALTSDVFGAAQDTLSTSVQWLLIYMMYFPEVQKKIQQELDSVLGDDVLPDITDSKHFPYTIAVMHEIFRHSTFTSTTIPHYTTAETTLNGYQVPKNMLVFINQYAANRDSRHWDNPDEFLPERFLNSDGKVIEKPQDRYLLFSYGSRKCPGDNLSRLMFIHIMSILLHLCEFESDPENPISLEGVYNLSMRPKELRTRIRIRKPELLDKSLSDLDQFSSHVQTVDAQNLSFTPDTSNKSSTTEKNIELKEKSENHQDKYLPPADQGFQPQEISKQSPFVTRIGSITDIVASTR